MWLFVLFVAVPLIEIALFVQIGGAIGLWPTLGIVILTAFIGTRLMRAQGVLAMSQLRQSFGQLNDPTEPLAHGAMILFSGALLLTPGFFTDFIGFALLIPAVRHAVFKWARARIKVSEFSMGASMGGHHSGQNPAGRPSQSDVIDGDYEDITPNKNPNQRGVEPPSGWTKN
jgi:UPF0716 protein FxsA